MSSVILHNGTVPVSNGRALSNDAFVAGVNDITGEHDKTPSEVASSLSNINDALGAAITAKGGTVASDSTLSDKAEEVGSIPSGGETIEGVLTKLVGRTLQYFKTGAVASGAPFIYAALGTASPTYGNVVFFSQRTSGAQLVSELFINASVMKYCNCGKVYAITGVNNFLNCRAIKSIVFQKYERYNTTLANQNAFTGSSIADGTGYVYFPDKDENGNNYPSIIKGLSNWAAYATQIRGYSDAPAYNANTEYGIGDVCQYNNKFYGYCKEDLQPATGQAPSGTTSDNSYWEYVGEIEA